MFQRCLLRAGVPVAFSGGFNPRPRVSIPLARSVGMQSCAERLCAVLETDEPVDVPEVKCQLQKQFPNGCRLLDVRCIEGKSSFHPCGVHYVFHMATSISDEHKCHLARCRKELEAGGHVMVQRYRAKKKSHQPIDIAPFIETLNFTDNTIEIHCHVSQKGTVRIDELMPWLNIEPGQFKEPVKRTEIQWIQNESRIRSAI